MEAAILLRTAAFAVAALLTLAACAGPDAAPSPPSPSSGVSGPDVRIVEENVADLHLWVSNQSFEDDPVALTVSIDGTQVVSQPFEVENQHNWILFPVELPPGRHVVNVVSGTGVELRESFTVPETGRRYASIDYWNEVGGRGRHIDWRIQSEPIAFA